MHKRKGWAADFAVKAHSMRKSPGKRSLACAEITEQGDNIPCFEAFADLSAELLGLFEE